MQLTGDANGCNEVESAYCLEMKLVIQDMQIPVHNTQRWLFELPSIKPITHASLSLLPNMLISIDKHYFE